MGWHFGGNLQPVRIICEIDWRECPSAVINYVWSEIVTDVVECLTNEWMMWRLIAMLFVCTLLIHTIYSKTRLMNATTSNRDNLNVVGCKVQDLELKVNILTYKMQYGTWPLPRQIRGTNIEGELRNVRLTLTNSTDRNAWLKHMLLSPSENASCVPYAKIGPRSVRCLTKLINLETKYMSSKFARDASPLSEREKSSRSTSLSAIEAEKISHPLINQEIPKKRQTSENFTTRNRSTVNETKENTADSRSETRIVKYRDNTKTWQRRSIETLMKKNFTTKRITAQPAETPEERVNATNETLNLVKEKLENLHGVLRIYGESGKKTNQTGESSQKMAQTILEDLKNIGNFVDTESDGKNYDTMEKTVDESESENFQKNNVDDEKQSYVESSSEFEQCRSDNDFSVSSNPENSHDDKNYETRENSNITNFPKNNEIAELSLKNHEKLRIPTNETYDEKIINEDLTKILPSSPISSLPEISSDTDDTTNANLLREALRFKNVLITRIEHETEENKIESMKSKVNDKNVINDDKNSIDELETNEPIWQKSKCQFQPKLLDIISEEQSAGSSNEKTTRLSEKNCMKVENPKIIKNRDLDNENSRQDLVSGSSEYFSLVNNDEINFDSDDNKQCKLREKSSKINDELERENLQKNIDNIFHHSVQNIRDYIEIFSRMQSDAIDDTKRAIDDVKIVEKTKKFYENYEKDENEDFSFLPREISSIDSITRFVNTIGETTSEELPRKLSEPSIIRIVDLEMEKSNELTTKNSTNWPDYELKRRPGEFSLASRIFQLNDAQTSSDERVDSIFESANSNDEEEEIFSRSTISCNELDNNYSNECDDDESVFNDNSTIFDDKIERERDYDEFSRIVDSPLTGRTVIRAKIGSKMDKREISMENSHESLINEITSKSCENEEIRELKNVGEDLRLDKNDDDAIFDDNIARESSSIYFTDRASFPELDTRFVEICDEKLSDIESNTWILEDFTNSMEINDIERKNENFDVKMEINENFDEKIEISGKIKNSYENLEKIDKNDILVDEDSKILRKNENLRKKLEINEKNENLVDEKLKLRQKDNFHEKMKLSREKSLENSKNSINNEISNVPSISEESSTYVDAGSRDFLDLSLTSLKNEKFFSNTSISKSARASYSSPIQQRISCTTPRRGASLNNATTEKTKKIDKITKIRDNSRETLKTTKTKLQQSKTTFSKSSKIEEIDRKNNSTKRDLESTKCDKRSRSQATPRKMENSPRNFPSNEQDKQKFEKNPNSNETKVKNVKSEKSRSPINSARNSNANDGGKNQKDSNFHEKIIKIVKSDKTNVSNKNLENSNSRLTKSLPKNCENFSPNDDEKISKNHNFHEKIIKIVKSDKTNSTNENLENSGSRLTKSSPRNFENSQLNETRKIDLNHDVPGNNFVKTAKSTLLISKNSSKSCIPVLRSRLEAVRQSSHEKRSKSPSRCPLTISTSSWCQDNTSLSKISTLNNIQNDGNSEISKNFTKIEPMTKISATRSNDVDETTENVEKLPESRTVIYVNIVTEQEQKSATRVVDPKKFLEYLKDRDLKIQSVEEREIQSAKSDGIFAKSPRVTTIVSSAVDDKTSENSTTMGLGLDGKWSLRVEQREIEVSAKPSVIDTSTSISDLPIEDKIDTTKFCDNEKFQIFEVPKELTKDEYIVLLEALNQDPNLHQLREMHKLCKKLGLGFHE